MSVKRACDLCGFMHKPTTRYGLTRQVYVRKGDTPREPLPHHRSYGAGALDICDACWEAKAKPNMRPGRKGLGFMAPEHLRRRLAVVDGEATG